MSKFKVGDKVKVISKNCSGIAPYHPEMFGKIYIITKDDSTNNNQYTFGDINEFGCWGDDELELVEDKPQSKFKVGDRVRVIHYEGVNQESVITGTKNIESKEHYILKDFSCYYGPKELEIVTTQPLTNTIITDIKDQAQHKRVQEKLFGMGCFWGGNSKETKERGDNCLAALGNSLLDTSSMNYWDSHQPSWPRITANDFLQEVDTPDPQYDLHGVTRNGSPVNIDKDYLEGVDFEFGMKPGTIIQKPRQMGESWYGKGIAEKIEEIKSYKYNKTKPMNNIVSFFNDLTVSAEDKELRKAGLKDDSLQWTLEAIEIVSNLEAKELGFKTFNEMAAKNCAETDLTPLEANTLFTKFYTKLLDTAKKYNRKDEKKAK